MTGAEPLPVTPLEPVLSLLDDPSSVLLVVRLVPLDATVALWPRPTVSQPVTATAARPVQAVAVATLCRPRARLSGVAVR